MTSEQKLLRLAAVLTLIGFGLLSALSASLPLSAPMGAVLDAVFWPIDGAQGAEASETRLLMGILGGITLGWGLTIWQLAGEPLARMPGLIRPILRNGVVAWFLLDSAGSLLAGAPLNVVANAIFAAMFLIPLARGARAAAA
jgi:hypothetical protein